MVSPGLDDGRGGSTRVVRSDPGPHPALRCAAAVGAARLSVALGEEHEDLRREAIAAAPWSGQTPS